MGEVGSRAWIDKGWSGSEAVGNETGAGPGGGRFFGDGSAGLLVESLSSGAGGGSTAVDGQRGRAEQSLKGPSAGQVEADAAGGLADAGADFEQLGAQSFDLG